MASRQTLSQETLSLASPVAQVCNLRRLVDGRELISLRRCFVRLPFDRLRANGKLDNPLVLGGIREALFESRVGKSILPVGCFLVPTARL